MIYTAEVRAGPYAGPHSRKKIGRYFPNVFVKVLVAAAALRRMPPKSQFENPPIRRNTLYSDRSSKSE
jgi:hypothetical protein